MAEAAIRSAQSTPYVLVNWLSPREIVHFVDFVK